MDNYIERRALMIGEYISEQKTTVRRAAEHFGVSKSTVHKDCVTTLREINPLLYREVREVLEINKRERHIRGGLATRKKYLLK